MTQNVSAAKFSRLRHYAKYDLIKFIGRFSPGGFCPRGGGFCTGGFCPRTGRNYVNVQNLDNVDGFSLRSIGFNQKGQLSLKTLSVVVSINLSMILCELTVVFVINIFTVKLIWNLPGWYQW